MAWKTVVQAVGHAESVRHPPWHDHRLYPGHLHPHFLLRDDPYLQRLPAAGILDVLYNATSLFLGSRRGRQSIEGKPIPKAL